MAVDKVNELTQILLDTLSDKTNYGEDFEDFVVYDRIPDSGGLHFPCIVVSREPAGTTDYFFGGGELRALNLIVEIAFKEKSGFISREHDYLTTETLVMWYEERLNEMVVDLEWDAVINVDSITTMSERHFPQEKNQELYGLTYTITINYIG